MSVFVVFFSSEKDLIKLSVVGRGNNKMACFFERIFIACVFRGPVDVDHSRRGHQRPRVRSSSSLYRESITRSDKLNM